MILVGHSYGGMVITGVADRALPNASAASSTSMPPTRSTASRSSTSPGPLSRRRAHLGQVVDGVELVLLPAPGAGAFYGVTRPR